MAFKDYAYFLKLINKAQKVRNNLFHLSSLCDVHRSDTNLRMEDYDG